MSYKHMTRDGREIELKDLSLDHLENILALIKKRAKEGVTISTGGGWLNVEDMWYDEDVIYGKEAKKYLHYKEYKKEYKRRIKQLNEILNKY